MVLYATSNLPLQKYIEAFAQALSLDMDAFLACYEAATYADRVQQDGIDARQAGIYSTPSFVIDGELLVGNQPYETFQAMIEEALASE
jgi:predicted DsbA family dithiol-disulfide isomerase